MLGIIPGAFAYAALGGTAADPLSAPLLGAAALVVALTGLGALGRRRLTRARAADSTEASGGERTRRRDEEQQRQG